MLFYKLRACLIINVAVRALSMETSYACVPDAASGTHQLSMIANAKTIPLCFMTKIINSKTKISNCKMLNAILCKSFYICKYFGGDLIKYIKKSYVKEMQQSI